MFSRLGKLVREDPKLGGYFQAASITACIAFWFVIFPGGAIAVLGAVAALMSIRKMGHRERLLWTIIVFALLVVELRSIRLDRKQHDAEQRTVLEEQRVHFGEIGNGIKAAIQKSDAQFQSTMSGTEMLIAKSTALATLSKENIDAITGGNSYCYALASPVGNDAWIAIATVGKSPLHEVLVERVDIDLQRKTIKPRQPLTDEQIRSWMHDYPAIPFLASTSGYTLDKLSLGDGDEREFSFTFSSMNGVWQENLKFRRVKGNWVQAIKVTRPVVGYGIGGFGVSLKQKVLYPFIDPNYPRVNGQVDWNGQPTSNIWH